MQFFYMKNRMQFCQMGVHDRSYPREKGKSSTMKQKRSNEKRSVLRQAAQRAATGYAACCVIRCTAVRRIYSTCLPA